MIIWIASYPKSGNTWVRAMIAALLYSEDGVFKFNQLSKIPRYPDKRYFENFTEKYDDLHEIKKYWLASQERINLGNETNFFKTHHMNCRIENYNFTNNENTLATIYIVRDPRNVVSSVSNYFSLPINESKNYLLTPRMLGRSFWNPSEREARSLLGTWKDNYRSWTANRRNLLILKYEDLVNNTTKELNNIIFFLKKFIDINTNDFKNKNIIKSTSFENLEKLESEGKFNEAAFNKTKNQAVKFFNLGPKNTWENILEKSIQKELEQNFKSEMEELNYL
jgi:hypothetical protein